MYQVHDPDSNTWTLFDDEKVRPLSRVNSHGSVGKKAANLNTNTRGKGGSAAGRLEKIGSRVGETDANEDAAVDKAESDADADLLRNAVRLFFSCRMFLSALVFSHDFMAIIYSWPQGVLKSSGVAKKGNQYS